MEYVLVRVVPLSCLLVAAMIIRIVTDGSGASLPLKIIFCVLSGMFARGHSIGIAGYTMVETAVLKPYYVFEKYMASIPAISVAQAALRRLEKDPVKPKGHKMFDHSVWDKLMRKHVHDGKVDYDGLRADSVDFKSYLKQLAVADLDVLDEREQLALYINAYNAFAIAHILPHENLQSILDLSTKDLQIWDAPAGIIAHETVSLNDIEHRRLRMQWALPEIHACIVCASISCPDLAPYAFTASTIHKTVADRARVWLHNENKGVALERGGRVARVSRIFLWFADDFLARGGPLGFASSIVSPDYRTAFEHRPTLRYFNYNWNLNKV